ncbi:MAG: hypothetical protein ACQPRJ_05310 [Solitalea-like symbiont of Acarus siro]
MQAVENFINANPDKYNFNSEQDKEKLMNDLKKYLSNEGLVGNPMTRWLIGGVFVAVVSIAIVGIYAIVLAKAITGIEYAQNQTSIMTRDTRASLLQLEKIILSIVENY